MKSLALKLLIIASLLLQYGCEIQFKRKSIQTSEPTAAMTQFEKYPLKQADDKANAKSKVEIPGKFTENDRHLISTYYTDKTNQVIRKDMITQTQLSKQQEEKLVVNAYIPRDVQVIPLPLKLERMLSALPLNLLRVHVGNQVIIMNVKSRQILDIIKI